MTYVVGFSPHQDDRGAVELACQLARSDGHDRVHAVVVVPESWPTRTAGDTDREFASWAAAQGDSAVAEARELLAKEPGIVAEASWVAARSVPQALLDQAATLEASLLVVGSGDEGPMSRVSVTSKTDRLLHSSPLPLALAPRGFHAAPDSRVSRVTVAFRGDAGSWALLDQAAEICGRVGAKMRLVTFAIRRPTMYPTRGVSGAEDMVHERWRQQARLELDEAIAHVLSLGWDEGRVESALASGRSWAGAMDTLDWQRDDVMAVGSSSSHRLAQVFLGSSAAKIVRNAPVPVIVVP